MMEMVDGADASRSRNAAKRSGPGPPPKEALRGPAGSKSSLPDDLPSLSAKSLLNGLFQMVDGGEMHSADLVGTSPLASFVPSATRRSKGLLPAQLTERQHSSGGPAHQRPPVHPTVTGTPKGGYLRRGHDAFQRARRQQPSRGT